MLEERIFFEIITDCDGILRKSRKSQNFYAWTITSSHRLLYWSTLMYLDQLRFSWTSVNRLKWSKVKLGLSYLFPCTCTCVLFFSSFLLLVYLTLYWYFKEKFCFSYSIGLLDYLFKMERVENRLGGSLLSISLYFYILLQHILPSNIV